MSADNGRWRRIYSTDWHAAPFQALDADQRMVWFYCETGPQSTSVGIWRMSTAVAVEDIGCEITPVQFDQRLAAVCEAFGWRFHPGTRVLWIPDWIERNIPQSPNVCVAWAKLLANVPDCEVKAEAARFIADYLDSNNFTEKFRSYIPGLSEDFRNISRKVSSKVETLSGVQPIPSPIALPIALPKPLPQPNQGAGETGRSGAGKQRAGARRRTADGGANVEPDARLCLIARQTLGVVAADADAETLYDSFMSCLSHSKIAVTPTPNRTQVLAAIEAVRGANGSGGLH